MPDSLRDQLEAFVIDEPGVALSFTRRLARENGWSLAFAERAVREYLRFVWLAMRAGHPVTPSLAVDEVWHLHLCYTRSYWDELCGKVLGRPLHHGPTRGGSAEDGKFRDWYARTLASYRAHFGEPPAELWPPVDERFRTGLLRKVDARAHWLVPKAAVRRAALAATALVAVGALAGCSGTMGPFDLTAIVLLVVGLVVGGIMLSRRQGRAEQKDSGCGAGGGSCGGMGCGSGPGGKGGGDGSGCGNDGGGGGDGGGSGCGGGGGCGD